MGSRGGLSLGWRGNSLISLKSFSSYHIDVEVQDNECGTKWRLTGQLNTDQSIPWVVIGDFNEITNSFEKKGGRQRSNKQMKDFRTTLKDCKLIDLGFRGCWFTWERGRQRSTNIRERLDRGVATLQWVELFSYYQVEHLSHSFSNHCPVLLDTLGRERDSLENMKHEFRFEAKWCLDGTFEELVKNWWIESDDSLPEKLEYMGLKMQKWSKDRNKEDKRTRVALEARLNCLYNEDASDDNLAEIAEIQLGLNLEADKEEVYWEQRARVNWLQHGDRNTSFFHNMAGQRNSRGRVLDLEDELGNRTSNRDEMIKIASRYFENLFSASAGEPDKHIFGLVKRRVTTSMNEVLLQQDAPLKAPGVDGFVAVFFQKYWHLVGDDISKYCLAILNGQSEVGVINRTRIVLIPKVDKPKTMSQFRPISLCNVLYKIIAKVLVNRMSSILGDCINEAQGAFISGRFISDNVLIAYEILHSLKMKKRGKKGNFALKLDMSKAYDRVEWDFLARMMNSMGFHNDWIVLIMRCVCSVSYSVSLNGLNRDWFSPSRGLRQGDPLSPYLFLICAEGFSSLLEDLKLKGSMEGAPIGRDRLSINHLFFADDCILFGDASLEGANVVHEVIKEYERTTGQRVNYDKSLIYFGANVSVQVREEITGMLGVRLASNPEKYLGLPMMVGRRKTWAFNSFIDRFRKRIEGWSLRYLSMGGKEVFIKSVLQATPLYAMQCFLFPKKLCEKLEIIMNRFWWTSNKTLRGIHWSCWDKLCLPKSASGMGFKNLFLFNKALLAKQVWRIITHPHCLLARVLKARYFPFIDVLNANVGSYPSFTWRSICNAREVIAEGMVWRVGSGAQINIWNDPWIPGIENNRISGHDIDSRWCTVNQLLETDKCTWNRELLGELFDEGTASRILSIPISADSEEDILVWKYEGSGEYTVRSGYRALNSILVHSNKYKVEEDYSEFYKALWFLNIPSKIKIHNWRLVSNMLPHYSNLSKRKLTGELICPLCKEATEDSCHLMWNCNLLRGVWTYFQIPFLDIGEPSDPQKNFSRNRLIHEGIKFQLQEVLGFIRGYISEADIVRQNLHLQVKPNSAELWRPPEVGVIKINFDASYQRKEKLAITAIIARNESGNILGAETYLVKEAVDPFVAEARACERAVLFAKARRYCRVIVEGDALSVIKCIKRGKKDKSLLRSITQKINHLGQNFQEIFYRYVPRSANGMAHMLAIEGRRSSFSGCWSDNLPESVTMLAEKESRVMGTEGGFS
ncbi:reverse transcriptase [Gossypium australe]|uniref:Reverse transcriptase n=1 Tax=Gossypium australe TaxID=47621 RepID=A0A5B6WIV6_9ROSI|nr:reverse transcriptase [Gossypium australe]